MDLQGEANGVFYLESGNGYILCTIIHAAITLTRPKTIANVLLNLVGRMGYC